MMRRTVSNNGILFVESITGIEIVGMPEQPQLLASCGVSCRFLGVVMLHPPLLLQTPPGVHPGPISGPA